MIVGRISGSSGRNGRTGLDVTDKSLQQANLLSLGDRSIHGAVYTNDFFNLTSLFGSDVKQERNWEFMIYLGR